jgi:acyl-homoserine-lactone acylase
MRAATLVIAALVVASAGAAPKYEARIRRTSYSIPHIEAVNFSSLGFGEGYAQAEDHICTIADQVVLARGERARYFGAGRSDEHLLSDAGLKALQTYEIGVRELANNAPEIRAWMEGFAAGYNEFLRRTGKEKLPQWCRGADWVFPITAKDLAAYRRLFVPPLSRFAGAIASTSPPSAKRPAPSARIDWHPPEMASNGWALGKDLSASRRGMLLANPHYPWLGANRFWEKHLTIPGKLDVYGVSLIGVPGVAIGFNSAVAWTHTVSAGKRQTFYTLELVPGKPTVYRYDGNERPMTSRSVTVEVKQPDGSLSKIERTVWFSHYGPVLNLAGIDWTEKQALTVRDAVWDNDRTSEQWLAMGRAQSLKEFQEAHANYQAMPWINTIAADAKGHAWYIDGAATPNLSPQALDLWKQRRTTDEATRRMYDRGIVLLDGSDSRFEWVAERGARSPGNVPLTRLPQATRTDYVFNANDSFWLNNSRALLSGSYSPLHGEQHRAVSLRTRNNDLTLSNRSPDKPAGADGRFTLDELGNAILSNRSLTAELIKDELATRCRAHPKVAIENEIVDLTDACDILAAWNGRYDVDSRGAVLFREFIFRYDPPDTARAGALFAIDFDPKAPVDTPRGLAPPGAKDDLALTNLAHAVRLLRSREIPIDVTLGEIQYANKTGPRLPVHGGDGGYEGITNMVRTGSNGTTLEPFAHLITLVKGSRYLTENGYPIGAGSSFLMVLEFGDKGPRAKAFLTYGESGDPESPHFTDQTRLFGKKQWRPILFRRDEIAADTKREYTVSADMGKR